jgi:hypothetical protein
MSQSHYLMECNEEQLFRNQMQLQPAAYTTMWLDIAAADELSVVRA